MMKHFFKFPSNSEAFTSEFLENLGEMFLLHDKFSESWTNESMDAVIMRGLMHYLFKNHLLSTREVQYN